jgi:hypothetical protein
MKPLSRNTSINLFVTLAVGMVAPRFHHRG